VAGNQTLYQKLLREFIATQSDAAAQLSALLEAQDLATAERLAHTVKGVAGTLGAALVQTAAGAVERAIADSAKKDTLSPKLDTLAAQLHALRDALMPLLANAKPTAPPAPAASPLSAEQIGSWVTELLGYLANFDPAAQDFVEVNRAMLANLFDAQALADFESSLGRYAFTDAQQQLQAAAAARGISVA
jgi:HPt (histidine-containing phosphotransfer) domain-containing protein